MKGKLFEKLLLKLSILDYRATLNTAKPKFGAIFVFLGTTSSFIEIISFSKNRSETGSHFVPLRLLGGE